MKKLFISQPMQGKTKKEIKEERQRALKEVQKKYPNEEFQVLDTFFQSMPSATPPLYFLGKAIQFLGVADVVYFVGEWKAYRGCRVEHMIAKEYDIPIIEE